MTLTHPVLLDDDESMADIAAALVKVQQHAADLCDVGVTTAVAQQAF
jgi:hypothetical protein